MLRFPVPVREHHCELRLAPQSTEYQRRLAMTIRVEPDARLHAHVDAFGNQVHAFCVLPPHDLLRTRLEAEVETLLVNPFDYRPIVPAREDEWLGEVLRAEPPLWDFVLHRSPFTPDLERVATGAPLPSRLPGRPILESVQTALEWIGERLVYRPGASDVDSPLEAVLREGAGVCQDFAHLLVAVVRRWGVPARYVAGYVDPGYADGAEAPGRQATHAWAEVLIPGAGWRGFDPVHGLVTNDTYVAVAVGRDYKDAAPQRGTFKGDDPGLAPEVTLQVTRQQQ